MFPSPSPFPFPFPFPSLCLSPFPFPSLCLFLPPALPPPQPPVRFPCPALPGDGTGLKCRPGVRRGTLGLRKRGEVFPERASWCC